MQTYIDYTNSQKFFLVALRFLIGWHFLYEGIVKLWTPTWSAAGYLSDSAGIFKNLFFWMAGNNTMLSIVDFINVWGLIIIGLAMILGLFTRVALIGGILLLGMYYLSHPPLIGVDYALPSEGSYLIVNKNLIELAALGVLYVFPTSHIVGLERFFKRT